MIEHLSLEELMEYETNLVKYVVTWEYLNHLGWKREEMTGLVAHNPLWDIENFLNGWNMWLNSSRYRHEAGYSPQQLEG